MLSNDNITSEGNEPVLNQFYTYIIQRPCSFITSQPLNNVSFQNDNFRDNSGLLRPYLRNYAKKSPAAHRRKTFRFKFIPLIARHNCYKKEEGELRKILAKLGGNALENLIRWKNKNFPFPSCGRSSLALLRSFTIF